MRDPYTQVNGLARQLRCIAGASEVHQRTTKGLWLVVWELLAQDGVDHRVPPRPARVQVPAYGAFLDHPAASTVRADAWFSGLRAPQIRCRRRTGGPGRRRPGVQATTLGGRENESEVFKSNLDKIDRSTTAHKNTQNALADALRSANLKPRSSMSNDPAFDIRLA